MPSTAWSGSISFGLVSIPVKLYSAVSRKTVRFHQVDTRTGARVRQKRVSAADGSEVAWDDIAKGYEQSDGEYVILTDSDLSALDPKATKTIEIEQFVDLTEIDPIMYDSAYNVVPDPSTPKPYKLLLEAMESSGKVAIARFVMRTKEHIAALRPLDGRLVLSTMVYADEVNDPSEFEALEAVSDVDVSAKERKVAEALIDSLTEDYDPAEYTDQYREKVLELIESKASGATEIVEGEPEEEDDDKVVDIMAALEASIAEAKKARKRHPSQKGKDDEADEDDEKPAKARKTTKKAAKKTSGRKAS
ncbi:Ku protein [Iamia majanohamensis]|uniref:Non-homologous end joining protein Ku n=1 Tax=Iamia majanohamensis TaxID=467976 RepID=A0AAE9Y3V1_9ACTN|nr:Ku protein [Iamia majanohamensis]WCO66050.1 Ku protein [Iamia majanohamensis]